MAEKKIRWGILSTANIGLKKVTPAILKSPYSEVVAVASRDLGKANAYIGELGLTGKARAYGTYEELFADPNIDAIYNPLPNHLHVEMTLAAARAGKHVLCEKPIALNAKEAEQLRLEARQAAADHRVQVQPPLIHAVCLSRPLHCLAPPCPWPPSGPPVQPLSLL